MQSFIEIEFVIWEKSMGRGPFLPATPGSNKVLKTPGQIELNVNFTYNKVLPSLMYIGLYHYEDSTSYERFLVVRKFTVT